MTTSKNQLKQTELGCVYFTNIHTEVLHVVRPYEGNESKLIHLEVSKIVSFLNEVTVEEILLSAHRFGWRLA